MCVALPCRVVSVSSGGSRSRPARVLLPDGSERDVDLVLLPAADVGDHVVVHSGFAVSLVPADSAQATLRLLGAETRGDDPTLPGPESTRT